MKEFWQLNKELPVYEIFNLLYEEKVEYIYRGEFDEEITDGILSLAEVDLNDQVDGTKIRKRIYFILVEGLQNVTRHQEKIEIESEYNEGFLAIQRKQTEYGITTGNLVNKKDIPKLKSILERINSLSEEELKEYYRQILDNDTFSSKGGAGLGLIEIARKSGNKIAYDFHDITDSHSYFYMQTTISSSKVELSNTAKSLENMKNIHQYFVKNDIILNVTGIFNHDKLVYLISILESQLTKQVVLKNKFFSIMIELMQNIVNHASSVEINQILGKHSVFFITSNNECFGLTTGNFIDADKVNKLQEYLKIINKLTIAELNKIHFDTLLNYKTAKNNEFGLGLIDIRIKSREPIEFNFEPINESNTFISMKVNLKQDVSRSRVLEIAPTLNTPRVVLDEKNGKFLFLGESYPENAQEFYRPILDWLEKYSENPRLFSLFEFKFHYLSTPSQKELIKIFNILERISSTSAVVVRCYYTKDNEGIYNFGLEFSKLYKIDFDFVECENFE